MSGEVGVVCQGQRRLKIWWILFPTQAPEQNLLLSTSKYGENFDFVYLLFF